MAPKDYVYHVMTRGNNPQVIFKNDGDYNRHLEILQQYREKYKFKMFHYVLMSNHVHLVLKPSDPGGSLSEIMKGINLLSYACYYKKKYRHVGHFGQDRYKSMIVGEGNYLLACASYVELNPVRAGIVQSPGKYRWSSYGCYVYGRNNPLLDKHPFYRNLGRNTGEHRQRYREFVKAMLKERTSMKGKMDRKPAYGSGDFIGMLTRKHKISGELRPRVRPKMQG